MKEYKPSNPKSRAKSASIDPDKLRAIEESLGDVGRASGAKTSDEFAVYRDSEAYDGSNTQHDIYSVNPAAISTNELAAKLTADNRPGEHGAYLKIEYIDKKTGETRYAQTAVRPMRKGGLSASELVAELGTFLERYGLDTLTGVDLVEIIDLAEVEGE